MIDDRVGTMTIFVRSGDILHAAPLVEALVNPVNCVGVMGRGLAKEIKERYPDNYNAYLRAYYRGELKPGRVFVFERRGDPEYIINFPTKFHWRNRSRLEFIDSGLESMVGEIQRRDIRSIVIPALGCGLGGLDWEDVRPRILEALRPLRNLRAVIYEPAAEVAKA